MKKYLIGIIFLEILIVILSTANLVEVVNSKARVDEVFKNVKDQFDFIDAIKRESSTIEVSENQTELLEKFNRESEINMVFIDASNNRVRIHCLLVISITIILLIITLKMYSMSKRGQHPGLADTHQQ